MDLGGHQEAATKAYRANVIRRGNRAAEAGQKTCRPVGVPQTPRLRRSRASATHLHQSRRRPDALHPEHFRHIAALLLLGQAPRHVGLTVMRYDFPPCTWANI